MSLLRGLLCGLFLWTVLAAPARAESAVPAAVRVVLADCENIVSRAKLVEHLRIELLSTGVQELDLIDPDGEPSSKTSSERVATLHVYYPECDDESGVVNLRISDRLTSKYVERALFVGDVSPNARPRTIALAIIELLRASWLELVLSEQSAESSSSYAMRNRMISRLKEATPDSAGGPRERRAFGDEELEDPYAPRWYRPRLEWIGSSRLYPAGGAGDLSTAVRTSLALSRRLRLHTGGVAAGGDARSPHDVHLFEAAGQLGLSLTGGTDVEVEVASLFEVGWARLNGHDIATQSSVLAMGAVHAMLRAGVTRGIDLIIGVLGGYVLAPLELNVGVGNERVGITGPVVGISFGLSGLL